VGDPIVIIGTGQAGVSLAVKLRDLRYDGGIVLVGDETAPPYQRPHYRRNISRAN
jgi:3-phenylpropionate/trans-cinnamate dioxygenase ferredoxin reductase subunit